MLSFIQNLLGTYTPPTYVSYIMDNAGEMVSVDIIPSGLAGVDWTFIITGLLFIVVVYAFFKALGGVICRLF